MMPTQSIMTDGHGNVVVAVNDSEHVDISIGRRRTIDIENTLVARDVKTIIDARVGRCFGRDDVLDELDAWVERVDRGVRVVAAPAGVGKSTVLANWIDRTSRRGASSAAKPTYIVRHFFARLYRETIDEAAALQHVHDQLAVAHGEQSVDDNNGTKDLRDRIYGYLKRDAPDGGRLIVVIDGIDETEPNFPVFLRDALGNGVYVVLGVRANDDAVPDAAKPWLVEFRDAYTERVVLASLDLAAVSAWLVSKIRGLSTLDTEALADRLHRISDGVPLFLQHLIDDLTSSPPTELRARVEAAGTPALPDSFGDYLRRELDEMRTARAGEGIDDLLAVLTQVRAPIAVSELSVLRDNHHAPLERCPFDRLDPRVARWLIKIGPSDDPQLAFAHPRLAVEFERCLLKHRVAAARRLLQRHAERWNEVGMEYALVHGFAHLTDETRLPKPDRAVVDRALRIFTDVEFHKRVVEREDGIRLLRQNATLARPLDHLASSEDRISAWRASLHEAALALSSVPGANRPNSLHRLLWEFSANLGVAEPESKGIRLTSARRHSAPLVQAIFEGHSDAVQGALVLADGDVLSWSNDRMLRRWSPDGTPRAAFKGHTRHVNSALALHNGDILSWSDDCTLRRWSSDGAHTVCFNGHRGSVHGAILLPDGDIVSWSHDGSLYRWSIDGSPSAIFLGHTAAVVGALLFADGDVLSWDSDGTLRRWSPDGTPRTVFDGHSFFVAGALVLPGDEVLSWSLDNTLRRWSADGRTEATFNGHTAGVAGALVLADGDVLSWSTDRTLRRWSSDGAELAIFKGHANRVRRAIVLPDGDILSWSTDCTLRRWSPNGMPGPIFLGHVGDVRGALSLPDGDILSWSDDRTLRRWSPDSTPRGVFEGHADCLRGASRLPDGDLLSWSLDGTLRRWPSNETTVADLERHTSLVGGGLRLPDGDLLTWSEDSTLRRWQSDGTPVAVFKGHSGPVSGACVLSNGRIVSWSIGGELRVWLPDGTPGPILEDDTSVVVGALSLANGHFVSWNSDDLLRRWSSDGICRAIFEMHPGRMQGAMLFDGDVLSWSSDGTLRRWSHDGAPVVVYQGHTSWVNGARILPNGDILSWSGDRTLRRWSPDGVPRAVFRGHKSQIHDTMIMSNEDIVSWSSDGALLRWFPDGTLRTAFEGHGTRVLGAVALSNGDTLSWCADGTLRSWALDGTPRKIFKGQPSNVLGARVLPDGDILSWDVTPTIRCWRSDGTLKQVWVPFREGRVLAVWPEDRQIAIDIGGRLHLLAIDATE